MIVLGRRMSAWEATTVAYIERQKPEYADVWTEYDRGTGTWNVMARKSSD